MTIDRLYDGFIAFMFGVVVTLLFISINIKGK